MEKINQRPEMTLFASDSKGISLVRKPGIFSLKKLFKPTVIVKVEQTRVTFIIKNVKNVYKNKKEAADKINEYLKRGYKIGYNNVEECIGCREYTTLNCECCQVPYCSKACQIIDH